MKNISHYNGYNFSLRKYYNIFKNYDVTEQEIIDMYHEHKNDKNAYIFLNINYRSSKNMELYLQDIACAFIPIVEHFIINVGVPSNIFPKEVVNYIKSKKSKKSARY
tara:strand:- start:161 stop:481 length:321 start_codon:yes stop_codon:yes gene_type:complete